MFAAKRLLFSVNTRAFSAVILAVRYFFANVSHVLVMFWHDFGQEWGVHHGHHVCVKSVRNYDGQLVTSVAMICH